MISLTQTNEHVSLLDPRVDHIRKPVNNYCSSKNLLNALLGFFAVLTVSTLAWVLYNTSTNSHGSNHGGLTVKRDAANATSYTEVMGNRTYLFEASLKCDTMDIVSWKCRACNKLKGVRNITVMEDTKRQWKVLLAYDSVMQQLLLVYDSDKENELLRDNRWDDYSGDTRRKCDHCQVHSALQRLYYEVKEKTWKVVKHYIQVFPEATVVIAGHSVGGVLAQFSVLDVKHHKDNVDNEQDLWLYTHGSPRWGNAHMMEYFAHKMHGTAGHWRVVFQHDEVTKQPPYEMGYRHTGNEVWYYCHEPLEFVVCGKAESDRCSHGSGIAKSMADHVYYYNYWLECDRRIGVLPPIPSTCDNVDNGDTDIDIDI